MRCVRNQVFTRNLFRKSLAQFRIGVEEKLLSALRKPIYSFSSEGTQQGGAHSRVLRVLCYSPDTSHIRHIFVLCLDLGLLLFNGLHIVQADIVRTAFAVGFSLITLHPTNLRVRISQVSLRWSDKEVSIPYT